MKIDILCYILCAIIILFPVISNYIKLIAIKHLIKRIMGFTLYFLEIYLIIFYLKNKLKIGSIDVSYWFCFLFLGAGISLVSFIIKNFYKRDLLYKLIRVSSVEGLLRPMLIEIVWGVATCAIEEIVWRGMIQDSICPQKKVIALIITSIVFVISHIKRKLSYSNMIELFVLSCVSGAIWIFTENILYCILFHWMRNNITIIITYKVNKI